VAVDLRDREIHTAAGNTHGYDRLISTMPLGKMLEASGHEVEPDQFAATEMANIRIGIRGATRTCCHWVYVADGDLPFHGIGFPANVNSRTCPPGCASLSVEYTIPAVGSRLSSQEIAALALQYVDHLGLLHVKECLTVSERRLSPAYVIRRAPGRRELGETGAMLAGHGVHLAGRFGTWDYLSIEEAFWSGLGAADASSESERA
jgi:protoporphyrinogen oxidase